MERGLPPRDWVVEGVVVEDDDLGLYVLGCARYAQVVGSILSHAPNDEVTMVLNANLHLSLLLNVAHSARCFALCSGNFLLGQLFHFEIYPVKDDVAGSGPDYQPKIRRIQNAKRKIG